MSARRAMLLALLAVPGCAPRQAIVETDPAGGVETRRQLEAASRNDLDRLRRLEEDHRAADGRYTYDLEVLGFAPSAGVRVSVVEATEDGFAAVAQAGSVECGVFVGSAGPPRAYTRAAALVACR